MHNEMKKLIFLGLSFLLFIGCSDINDIIEEEEMEMEEPAALTSPIPCEDGMAGPYPCNGYDLIGTFSLADLNAQSGNDSWGWTDASSGKEYAIMGLDNGTAFIDISDDENLIYLGKLNTATQASSWRDVKVYNDHAFIVSEAPGHGMQVFDLTKLRDVSNPPTSFQADARYTGFGNAHNIVINEETGFAYVEVLLEMMRFEGVLILLIFKTLKIQ